MLRAPPPPVDHEVDDNHEDPDAPSTDPAVYWRDRHYHSLRSYGFSSSGPRLWLDTAFQSMFRAAMTARIARITCDRRPFARAVDLGCGVGDWTLQYLQLAQEVVGVDINRNFLAHSQQRADRTLSPRERRRIDFVAADLREFTDYRGAGLVCLGGCAMYLADAHLEALFAAIVRTMPTNGALYLRTSVAADGLPRRELRHKNGLTILRPRADYIALAGRHGLRPLDATFSTVVLGEARLGPALGGWLGAQVHRRYDASRQFDYCNFLFVPRCLRAADPPTQA